MIISHQNRFVFVKTRKTAGTSIEIVLSQNCGVTDIITPITPEDEEIRRMAGGLGPQHYEPLFYNHAPVQVAQNFLLETGRGPYFSFCVERNPFDKAISLYFWRTRNRSPRPDINATIRSTPVELISNWNLYASGDTVLVDQIIRYEHLGADLSEVASRLGYASEIDIGGIQAKAGIRANNLPPSQLLTPETIQWIANQCAREISYFGYSVE